jgi:hypothetical protein
MVCLHAMMRCHMMRSQLLRVPHTHTHTHTHTQETMVLERIGSLLGDETYLLSVTKDLLAELKVSACQEAALIVMEELPMLR